MKYFFLKMKVEGRERRLYPISGQEFEDGTPVNGDWHVSASREIRYVYPETTIFGTAGLSQVAGTHYGAGALFPMTCTPRNAAETPPPSMKIAWNDILTARPDVLTEGGGEPAPAPKKAKAAGTPATLREKILSEVRMPTIDEDGFYVNRKTFELVARNLVKKVHTLLWGPSGTGKTEVVYALAAGMDYEVCAYDMGSMHDPMSQMLGTHRIGAEGKSVFDYARFVSDVSEGPRDGFKGRVILLDELSRAPLTTLNILFPCLDARRTLPVEMAGGDDARSVRVDKNVVFVATANIGAEFTGTEELDKALKTRFLFHQLDYMPAGEEESVLVKRCGISDVDAKNIVRVAGVIRDNHRKGELGEDVSTRETLRAASLVSDGWSVKEALELVFLPIFEGTDSTGERSIVRKIFAAY